MTQKPNALLTCTAAIILVLVVTPVLWAADPLAITANPNSGPPGTKVTFSIVPKVMFEGDIVNLNFGDGTSGKIEYFVGCSIIGGCDTAEHAYAGAGTFTVVATGVLSGHNVEGTVKVTISTPPVEAEYFIATGSHAPGYNNTTWRTDLEIHNPGPTIFTYEISPLLEKKDNSSAPKTSFSLYPFQSAHYGDVLYSLFNVTGGAAIRIKPLFGKAMIYSRTYNQLDKGSFGQFVPAIMRAQAIPFDKEARLIGLFHNPALTEGFRTNVGFVNLSPAPISVEVSFYTGRGALLAVKMYELQALEYRQQNRIFEEASKNPIEGGFLVLKARTTGALFIAYASMVDNVTGDPIFIPAQMPE
jgi:hypothetical protein